MYKIIAPLEANMQGKDIANLQAALKLLLDKGLFTLRNRGQREVFEGYIEQETDGSLYGRATTELVRAFQLQYRLEGTGRIDENTAEFINGFLKEFEEKFSSVQIKGSVRYSDGKPVTGLIVKAYNKGLRSRKFLGETVTDQFGVYKITYSRQQFRRAEKKSTDLLVCLFERNDPDQILAESDILFNAQETAEINLTLESKLSEYERLLGTLSPLLQGENVSPADLTEEDIDFLIHKTGFEKHFLQIYAAAARIASESAVDPDISFTEYMAIFYGLGRKGQQLEMKEILVQDFYLLRIILNEAQEENIIPKLQSNIIKIFFKDLERSFNASGLEKPNTHIDVQQKNMHIIGEMLGVYSDKMSILIEKAVSFSGVTDKLLESFVNEGKLEESEAEYFGLSVKIYQLLDGDMLLLQHFLMMHDQDKVKDIKDLALFNRSDWSKYIEEVNVTPPHEMSRIEYAGFLIKRIAKHYPLEVLLTNIRLSGEYEVSQEIAVEDKLINRYPGLSLSKIVKDKTLSVDNKFERIKERIQLFDLFQRKNSSIELLWIDYTSASEDLLSLDFTGFTEEEKEMIRSNIHALQSLYFLTCNVDHTVKLLDDGYGFFFTLQ